MLRTKKTFLFLFTLLFLLIAGWGASRLLYFPPHYTTDILIESEVMGARQVVKILGRDVEFRSGIFFNSVMKNQEDYREYLDEMQVKTDWSVREEGLALAMICCWLAESRDVAPIEVELSISSDLTSVYLLSALKNLLNKGGIRRDKALRIAVSFLRAHGGSSAFLDSKRVAWQLAKDCDSISDLDSDLNPDHFGL